MGGSGGSVCRSGQLSFHLYGKEGSANGTGQENQGGAVLIITMRSRVKRGQ